MSRAKTTRPKKRKSRDMLVQTILPRAVAERVKAQAEKEGISVAAWMRRFIMQEKERATALKVAAEQGLARETAMGLRLEKLEARIRQVEAAIVRWARGGSLHEPGCQAATPHERIVSPCCYCGRIIGEELHKPDCPRRSPDLDPLGGPCSCWIGRFDIDPLSE